MSERNYDEKNYDEMVSKLTLTPQTSPTCFRCDVPTHHVPDGGFWVCPYCSEASTNHKTTTDGPVLGRADPERDPILVVGEIATKDGLRAMLRTPFSSKEDLKTLPDEADARWNPNRTVWTVAADAVSILEEHMDSLGWTVVDLVMLREERSSG
jgi:hypothetical protein